MSNKWRVVVRQADGEKTETEYDTREEALRNASKKDAVFAPDSPWPKVVYNRDRTLRIVNSDKQYAALMAENKKGEDPVWGDSPMTFGIETHPGYNPATSTSERW